MSIVSSIGGRKAAACLTGIVVIVGCFLLKGTLPDQLVDAVKYLVSTYLAGNVASDLVENVANRPAAAPPVDISGIQSSVEQVKNELGQVRAAVQTQDETIRQIIAAIQK